MLAAQIESILRLQHLHGPLPAMRAFSFLGNEEFFLLLLPLFYFCIHPRTGLRLGLLLLAGDTLNQFLKLSLSQPRPYWIDPRITPLSKEASFGFPSGHAQNAVSVWGYLASLSRRRWAWVAAGLLALLISLSRVYLAVHFWTDVLSGLVIGVLALYVFLWGEPKLEVWFERQSLSRQVAATTIAVAILFLMGCGAQTLSAQSDTLAYTHFAAGARSWEPLVSRLGALWGLGIGWALALKGEPFSATGPISLRFLRWLVGMIGILFLWKGLPLLLPVQAGLPALTLRFIRYALMTAWVTFLAPKLFLKLGLASPEGRRS